MIRNPLAIMTVLTCVSLSNLGESNAMLSQLRKTLRAGFRDGSILDLLYHDGIVGYMMSSSSDDNRTRRKDTGKQANATEDSNFFTSGFGGEGACSHVRYFDKGVMPKLH